MSNITLPAALASAKVDTYVRESDGASVHVQAMMIANPMGQVQGTISANGGIVSISDLFDMDGVMVRVNGTFTGSIVFEASDDQTNWYPIYMVRGSSAAGESSRALSGTTLESWRANIAGWRFFRVRCTAYTSGTATITISPITLPFEPAAVQSTGGSVTATLAASTNLAADVSNGVRTTATNAMLRQKIISAASTNATLVKNAAGRVYGWQLTNTHATAVRYVKIYNKASAPTVGTDVPTDVIAIPPGSNVDVLGTIGVSYATGIALAITGGPTDNDATAVAANDVIGSLFYA